MVLPSRAATAAARSRRVAATRNAICGEVAVPDAVLARCLGEPDQHPPIMSDTISFADQYSDTVPDTPPSSGITADSLTGHSVRGLTSANADCSKSAAPSRVTMGLRNRLSFCS